MPWNMRGGGGSDGQNGTPCHCDESCFKLGDCCADVCDACSDLEGCVNSVSPCQVTLCDEDLTDLDPEADPEGCIVVRVSQDQVEAAASQDGLHCAQIPQQNLCDDQNSCTNSFCDPYAQPETSGCAHTPRATGDSCTGKELCNAPGVPGACEASDDPAGVSCVKQQNSPSFLSRSQSLYREHMQFRNGPV